jgi:carboxymethylenebutenolidase
MRRASAFALLGLLAAGSLAPAYGPVQAAENVGKDMTLPATERAVHVKLFRAPGDAPRPSVLLLHGAGGFDGRIADYDRYADSFAKAGIDAYLVYYYSDADARQMNAGAEIFETRYAAWAKSVDDMADYLEKQKNSNGRVGVIGFSNGAILATGAVTLDPKINAAVIYYGTEPWPLGVPAKRYPPLLILHGDADRIIPVDAGKELAAAAKKLGGPVDLVIYPGEMHGFGPKLNEKNGADALNRSLAFMEKELLAK